MFERLSRQIRTVLRFLFPTPAEREYAQLLRGNPQFDRAFYLESNPRMRRLFRLSPERHYVQFGEALGLSPNPHFSPRAYLFHNPDLTGIGMPPLRHYLETGRREGRTALITADQHATPLSDFPEIAAEDWPSSPAPVAIVIHLYYPELWREIADRLARQSFAFDLFVTVTSGRTDIGTFQKEIRARFPEARIWEMPNHGRDIWPFVYLVNSGLLAPYRAVCKLHTKKSPHRADGDAWRQALFDGVLGSDSADVLQKFIDNSRAGFWVADGHRHQGEEWWGINRSRGAALLARIGLNPDATPLIFPAGSIYWIKPEIMTQIRAMRLGAEAFEPEQALVDGTTAHALERAFGYLAVSNDMTVLERSELS